MFWKKNDSGKKIIHSFEYEELVNRISSGLGRIGVLEVTLEAIKTDLSNLRGKFNAKLKGIKEEEVKEEEKKTETINNNEFVAFG